MQIAIATEADIPEMHRVRVSVRENRLGDPTLVEPRHYREMLAERGRGWVARVDGEIVGFAVADLRGSNVWALFVSPGFEGRGVGRRLHDAMMDWLFAAGAETVWLGTEPGTRAERFYASAGWIHAGFQPNGEIRFEMARARWAQRAKASSTASTSPGASGRAGSA